MKTSKESGTYLPDGNLRGGLSGFTPDSLEADHWLWDGEFRSTDPAVIPLRKRMARAWARAEMQRDEQELRELWG